MELLLVTEKLLDRDPLFEKHDPFFEDFETLSLFIKLSPDLMQETFRDLVEMRKRNDRRGYQRCFVFSVPDLGRNRAFDKRLNGFKELRNERSKANGRQSFFLVS